jgi:hypothetical protein
MEIKRLVETVKGDGNFMLYGPSGSGKTYSLSTLPGKSLILAAEKGLRTLVDICPDTDVAEINKMEDMREVFKIAQSHEYDTIAVDSLSELAELALDEAKKESKDGRQHYMLMADKIDGMIRAFNTLPTTIIWICQEDRVNQEDAGVLDYCIAPALPGRKYGMKLPYKLDFIFCMRNRVEEGEVKRAFQTGMHGDYLAKARSTKLKTFEPANWEVIFNKLKGE